MSNTRVGLTGSAGTFAQVSGVRVYVTSGDAGGLLVFDGRNLQLQQQVDLPDARWVGVRKMNVLVVQGTPG